MQLFKIRTHFYGKDLDEEASLGYVVAENDDAIYDYIDKAQVQRVVGIRKDDSRGDHRGERRLRLRVQGRVL